MPYRKTLKAVQHKIVVELEDGTSFDTAGAQAHLWLAAYYEIMFEDFFGRLDYDLVARLRAHPYQPARSMIGFRGHPLRRDVPSQP